jgi:hypothetical protein
MEMLNLCPITAEISEGGWLIVMAIALLFALSALCLVFALVTYPVSKRLDEREEREQDFHKRLETVEHDCKIFYYALKKHGILRSHRDIESPPLKIDQDSA